MVNANQIKQWSTSDREEIVSVLRSLKPYAQRRGYIVAVMLDEDRFDAPVEALPGEPEDIALEWSDGENTHTVSVRNDGCIDYYHDREDGGETKDNRSFDSLEDLASQFPSLLDD